MFRTVIALVLLSHVFGNELTTGIRYFASDFYQECANLIASGNLIVSPFSVTSALALLSQAAHGNTFDEIKTELRLNSDKTTVANQFENYFASLHRDAGATILSIANQIYVQNGYTIKKSFADVATQSFLSGIESVNFVNKIETARKINQFVEQKTNDKIKNLIKPDTLDGDSRVVLINAVYFKGDWKHKFNREFTTKGDFYINERDAISVDFMHMDEHHSFGHLTDLDATALQMNYFNSNFSMVFVLPNSRTGLPELESKLKRYDFTKISSAMHSHRVEVDIPKFKVEFETNMNDVLRNLGMADMFTSNADLSGLLDVKEPLYVSDSIHKAYIEINEEGSEAAAATGFVITKRIGGVSSAAFYADHPFIYYIWDNTSKTVLFIGRITKF